MTPKNGFQFAKNKVTLFFFLPLKRLVIDIVFMLELGIMDQKVETESRLLIVTEKSCI